MDLLNIEIIPTGEEVMIRSFLIVNKSFYLHLSKCLISQQCIFKNVLNSSILEQADYFNGYLITYSNEIT